MFGKKWSATRPHVERSTTHPVPEAFAADVPELIKVEPYDRQPFSLAALPEYQSYMPFVVLLPPLVRGPNSEAVDEVRYQFLQEALYTAERWHARVEEIHIQSKIDAQKRDDFHEHIAHVLDDLRHNTNPAFWLSIRAEPKNTFVHHLIRDYLAANSNNRPRPPRPPMTSEELHFGVQADIFVAADDFLSQGCSQEPGIITSPLNVTDAYIIYGPYRRYPVGIYEVAFDITYETRVTVPGLTLTIDVTQNGNILTARKYDSLTLPGDKKPKTVRVTFSDPDALTEFRIHVAGHIPGTKIIFKGVRLFTQ